MSGRAVERLSASEIERLVVTNTIPLRDDGLGSRLETVSVAGLFADAIAAIHGGDSISKLFS